MVRNAHVTSCRVKDDRVNRVASGAREPGTFSVPHGTGYALNGSPAITRDLRTSPGHNGDTHTIRCIYEKTKSK